MGTYNRDTDFTGEVKSLNDSLQELKQTQIIGNDNLRVYRFTDTLAGQTLTASTNAIFKFTFTFDSPSNSYILPRFVLINQTSAYNATFYADPATINSDTSRSWFYSITTTTTVTGVTVIADLQCSDSGTTSIARTV